MDKKEVHLDLIPSRTALYTQKMYIFGHFSVLKLNKLKGY